MDYLEKTNVENHIKLLYILHEDIYYIPVMINLCSYEENAYASRIFHTQLPTWIFTSYKVANRIRHLRDNFAKLYSRQYSATISEALHSELTDIYHALCCHKKANTDGVESIDFKNNLQDAEQHLFRAATLREFTKSVTAKTHFLSDFISNLFIRYKPSTIHNHYIQNNSKDQPPVSLFDMADSAYMNKKVSKRIIYNRTETESQGIRISSNDGTHRSGKIERHCHASGPH